MKKELIFTILFFVFVATVLALGLRGIAGNPTSTALNDPTVWGEDGPLELSPDRGRFALMYSVAEDHSVKFSLPIARFTTPDLGINSAGEYVSLFAPGVSFAVLPGYFVGKALGASQVGAFAVIALFALLNAVLVRAIAMRFGAGAYAASIGAIAFLFATPAFAYAVTLYQHHISTFFILSSFYALLRWRGFWPVAYVWFALGFSLLVDSPNLFLMLPLGLWALSRIVWFEHDERGLHINLSFFNVLTFVGVIIPLALLLWFNAASNGSPFQLSGTLQRIEAIDEGGKPAQSELARRLGLVEPELNQKKSAIRFFNPRNMLNGFYVHFLSPDRGIVSFTPVMLLGFIGIALAFHRNLIVGRVLIGVLGFNILLYSMWGDPYGGWAFGSRYLIPSYAILGIGLALLLGRWRKQYIVLTVFILLFGWSAWINVLGAVTSSRNPPQVEVLNLEKISGREEKYTFARNEQFMREEGLKSFVFNTIGHKYVSANRYRATLTGLVVGACTLMLGGLALQRKKENAYE